MPPRSSEVSSRRAKVGGLVRTGATPDRIEAAQRDLKASVAEQYIRRLVDEAPVPTPEQRARLAVLLLAPAAVDGAA